MCVNASTPPAERRAPATKDMPMIAPPYSFPCRSRRNDADELEEELVRQFFRPFKPEVLLCPLLKRSYVLVHPDDLAAASAVARLAASQLNWQLLLLTDADLDRRIAEAEAAFASLEGVSPELAVTLVEEGLFSFGDLANVPPARLMSIGNLSQPQTQYLIEEAGRRARTLA